MLKILFILAIGVAAGYHIGWKDAKRNKVSVVERTLDRVGGKARGQYNADVDAQMERIERR